MTCVLAKTPDFAMRIRQVLPTIAVHVQVPLITYQDYACVSIRQLLNILQDTLTVRSINPIQFH